MSEEKGIEVKNVQEAQEKLAEIAKDSSINKPSEEECEVAGKEFDDAAKVFNGKIFEIGTEKEFKEVSEFMITFLNKFVYWTKNGWMGVLKLEEEVTAMIKTHKKGDGGYKLGYQALEFLFYVLTNPGGNGIETAREIEKVAEMYGKMVEISGKKLEAARAELKDIQWLQEKYNAMLQGFYLEKEDGVELVEAPEEEPAETTQSPE